jgi:hypothetical protein
MKYFVHSAVFFLLAAGVCVAQSEQQPSLGDLARKHEGSNKRPTKTFTNDDVATQHSSAPQENSAASSPALSNTAVTPNASAKADTKADNKKSEPATGAKDTPEIAELKSKINSYRAEQDNWKHSATRYQNLLATETSEFRRQMYQDALEGDQNNVQVFQNKIDEAQADLARAEQAQSGH